MSRTARVHAKQFTYRRLNRRTLDGIQKKVIKQSNRNPVSRFLLSKADKDKIAGWKQDLFRILQVFNVRSNASVGHSQT